MVLRVWSKVSLRKSVLVKKNILSGQKKDVYDLSLVLRMLHNPQCIDVQNKAISKIILPVAMDAFFTA